MNNKTTKEKSYSPFFEEINNKRTKAENTIYSEPNRIKLYVESDADIPFWYAIFKRFAPKLKLEITRYKGSEETSSGFDCDDAEKKKISTGKHILLKRARIYEDFVGSNTLICVDSDYDFLVRRTESSRTVRSKKPYIFQTYTYAIENYKCLAESLSCICTDATYNAREEFDFVAFLKEYSKSIYELFVFSVYSEIKDLKKPIKCRKNVAIGDKLDIENNGKKTIDIIEQKTKKEIEQIKKELLDIQPDFEKEINKIKRKLERRGIKPENVYLFIDAHVLFDGVVAPILRKIYSKLKRHRHKELSGEADSSDNQIDKEIKSNMHKNYEKVTVDPIKLLNANKAHFYFDCHPIKCIERDIKKYLNKHPP